MVLISLMSRRSLLARRSPLKMTDFTIQKQRFVTLGLPERRLRITRAYRDSGTLFVSSHYERRLKMSKLSSSKTSKTDWPRIKTMKEEDITLTDEHPASEVKHIVRGIVRRGLRPVPPKASISLRIDADVLEWFKAQGGRIPDADERRCCGPSRTRQAQGQIIRISSTKRPTEFLRSMKFGTSP